MSIKSMESAVLDEILKDHIEHCIVHAVEENDQEAIKELENAIDSLLK